jgi:hypothetical protein
MAMAAGASAAVIALSLWLEFSSAPRAVRLLQTPKSHERVASGTQAESIETGLIDIDAAIRHEERSARLATSIRFLASVPIVRQDMERAERYLRDVYGTDADAPYHN